MRLVTNWVTICKKCGGRGQVRSTWNEGVQGDSVTRDLGQAYRTPVN